MVSIVLTDSPVVKSADSSVCGRVSFIYGPGATMHRALNGRDPSYGALWFQPGQSPVRTRSPAPFSPKWICKFFNTHPAPPVPVAEKHRYGIDLLLKTGALR